MSDIRTKPVTPEYEETWERIFGKDKNTENVFIPIGIFDENIKEDVERIIRMRTEVIPIL